MSDATVRARPNGSPAGEVIQAVGLRITRLVVSDATVRDVPSEHAKRRGFEPLASVRFENSASSPCNNRSKTGRKQPY